MLAEVFLKGKNIKTTNLVGTECFINGTFDSRKVSKNYLYFDFNDGKYVEDALARGASAVVSEKFCDDYPCVCVASVRRSFGEFCAEYYSHPEKKLKFIAVVGTNGKTSTVKIIDRILSFSGYRTANIGTLGAVVDGVTFFTGMTTPDSDTFFKLLNEAVRKKVDYVVLEWSAHAIFFEKLSEISFDYCVFCNATPDHLDFFKDMQSYIAVKKRAVCSDRVKTAVINADSPVGLEIIKERQGRSISYGLRNPADAFAVDWRYCPGIDCVINISDRITKLRTPLSGEFNLYNILAAISVCVDLGVSLSVAATALSVMPEIDGRFNVLYGKTTVIIDYAHTPDGLKQVLIAARTMTTKKLFVVFGCGGDRDRQKRSVMGKIASEYADCTIITTDNPRSEKPEKIIEEIAEGIKSSGKDYVTIVDRYEAIRLALDIAGQGDVVVVAGKGAEEYIDTAVGKLPFSDKAVCEQLLRRKPQ